MKDAARVSAEVIQKHSKSFAMASRVLPPDARLHAVALYAWCRRADDAVDLVAPERQQEALDTLSEELRLVYEGAAQDDPVLALFQETVLERRIPLRYAQDLLHGMAMDVGGQRYESMDDLLIYCYHVAGCVGLMMCHAMGVRDDWALVNATHLGMAMQITNICRDVVEDWERDRLYIPDELLAECGAPGLAGRLGSSFPAEAAEPVSRAVARLLDEADLYYASGDAGLPALSWRCSMSIRTARSVYSAIGDRLRRVGCDPLAGRQYVPRGRKLGLMTASILRSAGGVLGGAARGRPVSIPKRVLTFPDEILPLSQEHHRLSRARHE
jgi:phytoene synthase